MAHSETADQAYTHTFIHLGAEANHNIRVGCLNVKGIKTKVDFVLKLLDSL